MTGSRIRSIINITISCCMFIMGPSTLKAATIAVGNNSFESPSSCNACYGPAGYSWTFTSNAGILSSGNLDVATPDGAQTGWLQYTGIGNAPAISQVLTGFNIGDDYSVTFDWAMRTRFADAMAMTVSMDANNLGTYTPGTTSWSAMTTSSFTATSTSYTLSFTGNIAPLTQAEADTNIDMVVVNDLGPATASPEPGSFIMLGSALAGLVLRSMTRRRAGR
jgi:hypothetical protein